MKAVLRAFVLFLFAYGQLGFTAHAHEHEHEEDTNHSVCEYCILAFSEAEECIDDLNGPANLDGPDFPNANVVKYVHQSFDGSVSFGLSRELQLSPTRNDIFSDGVRAPPQK